MTREWRSQQCDEEVSSLTQRMRNCLSSHPVEMPDIPDELLSLLRLYSLTKSKERRLKQAGDELLFRELTNVSRLPGSGRFLKRYFTRSLLQMKELVTRESAAFLQEQAQCLQPPLVLSPLREVSVEGPYPGIIRYQHEFPCLFQFHVIFRRALEAGIGVLLKIRSSEDSPLDPNSYLLRQEFRAIDGEYTMVEEKSTSQVCIAVEARARQPRQCLNRDLLRRTLQRGGGLLGVLWMGAAQHTQFSDGKDDGLSDVQKNEIQVLASKAQQLGFSRCNPSLCCLEHIYCAAPNQETGSG